MVAKIKTIMQTTSESLWKEIIRPSSLQFVASPILYFYPKEDCSFNDKWEIDKEYNLRLILFNVIPLGSHKIIVKNIDTSKNKIVSNESGLLAKVWNHTIEFSEINPNQILYEDTIEIKSGLFTVFIWLFSHFFYRHRQRKWKILLSKNKR